MSEETKLEAQMPHLNGLTSSAELRGWGRLHKEKLKTVSISQFITRWWKSVVSFMAILATVLSMGLSGYLINDKLNSFVTTPDLSSFATQSDIKTLTESIKSIQDINQQQSDQLKVIDERVYKIYEIVVSKKK